MRGIDLIASFELEINKLDDAIRKPVTDDSLYWINQAVMKFVRDRFNGNAPKRTSYEQNEKRTRDLVKLLKEFTVVFYSMPDLHDETYVRKDEVYTSEDYVHANLDDPTAGFYTEHEDYDIYEYNYPADLLYVLNEDVVISDLDGDYKTDTCVFECTADNFMYRINNSLTDFHYRYHRARPLRIRTNDGFRLLTDKNYKINTYTLGYLKIPTEVTAQDPEMEYTDFDDNTWLEIIKIAAQMYVEN